MKPIISPWLFYLVDLSDGLNTVFGLLLLLSVLATLIAIVCMIFCCIDYGKDEEYKGIVSILKKLLIPIILISATGMILTPSESTVYKMIVADNITPHNIEIIGDTGKDVVDYIVESVDKLMEEDDDE